MDIKIQKEEATAVAVLSGKLDSMSVPDVEEGLLDIAEDEDLENIVLDCTDLEYIASSGLRLFFAIAKNARTREARVVIKNPCDFVRQTLHMTGLSSMFEYE